MATRLYTRRGLPLKERLLRRSKPGPNGCVDFIGATSPFGYGITSMDGQNVMAHRAAWTVYKGPIPLDTLVLHRCDRPICINPDHLFLGTHQDNIADKLAKGRQARDESHGISRLTIRQVRYIRRRIQKPHIVSHIARELGVAPQTVHDVINGETWAHVR